MTMKVVNTLAELRSAIAREEAEIVCYGEAAKAIRSKAKKRKMTKIIAAGFATIGGLALIPFTGGTSAAASICGLTVTTVAGFSLTISAAELALLLGAPLAMIALRLGYDCVEFKSGGIIMKKHSN